MKTFAKASLNVVVLILAGMFLAPHVCAQSTAPTKKTEAELQKLVGPIALYPDSLVAHILPASTVPVDIVEAARYLREHGDKVETSPEVPWLPSVRALLRFPDVLYKMDKELSWTRELGEAVIAQQNDVMDAIQHMRKLAEEAGALKSNDKQIVIVEKEVIKIVPASPEIIYVPVYDPVVVYVPQPTTTTIVVQDNNDDEAAAALVGFGVGLLVGAAFADDDCDWHGHVVYHGGYYGWAGNYPPVATPYNPRGIYDPRGVYDPRGLYDPRGAYDPRGVYDPRGAADPRGVYDPRGVADPRGAADPRGVYDTRGVADPRGVGDPRGAAGVGTVGAGTRGAGVGGGARGAAGVGTVGAGTAGAGARGYSNPSAMQGSLGTPTQGAASNRASARGSSSLSSGNRSMAGSGGGRGGAGGGGRSGGGRR